VVHYGLYASLLLIAEIHHTTITPDLHHKFALVGICIHFSYFFPEVLVGIFYLFKERRILFNPMPL